MNTKRNNALIIFLRTPVLGKVKTRLAATLGERAALDIYKRLIEITLTQAKSSKFTSYLYFYPKIDSSLVPEGFLARKQDGGDLGEKMKRAFSETLDKHDRVIIIGTDCPYIRTDLIDEAFTSLRHSDVVVGPANDGGYYLLGLGKLIPELFDNMPWSTENVLEETRRRIRNLDLSLTSLETLEDIDFKDDWHRYLNTLGETT